MMDHHSLRYIKASKLGGENKLWRTQDVNKTGPIRNWSDVDYFQEGNSTTLQQSAWPVLVLPVQTRPSGMASALGYRRWEQEQGPWPWRQDSERGHELGTHPVLGHWSTPTTALSICPRCPHEVTKATRRQGPEYLTIQVQNLTVNLGVLFLVIVRRVSTLVTVILLYSNISRPSKIDCK